ncbi:MAG TPA: hypothetical protein VIC28_07230 [Thermoanaerobaculia bacterium]|jgi:hypothetical protein
MKPLHLAAILVTFLLVVSAVNSLMRPQPRPETARKKKTAPVKVAERCMIKRAVFGGTEAAVLKVRKDRTIHYVVLDLPTNDPLVPEYQSRWLDANYGQAQPDVIGVYPTVDEAMTKAASLCRRN